MSNFDEAFKLLIDAEQGFTIDDGGETMWGITKDVAREGGYDGNMPDLPLEKAKEIAKKYFWDNYMCDQFDPRLAFQLFDAAYNSGTVAVLWLQQAISVKQDRIIGPITIAEARKNDVSKVILRFNSYRLQYLTTLKNWPKYAKGWSRRIAKNLLTGATNLQK